MKQLSLRLPPFAPDYSGVCSALFELGGMIVIHDACGCTGNYTGFDEPRWYGSKSEVYCSGLRQIDAILGDDEKLIGRIMQAAREMHPKFICITGSPVPMIIGTDFEGIAGEVEQRYGAPAFGFPTTGLKLYDEGAGNAFCALAKKFARKAQTQKGAVNLLGLTPLDFYVSDNAEDIKAAFKKRGYEVLSSYAMGTSLEDIEKSAEAQVNIVVSQSGLAVAKYFYDTYRIPYVAGLPVGEKASEIFFSAVQQSMDDGLNRVLTGKREQGKKRVLIMGERIASGAMRLCLEQDYGMDGIAVAGIFSPCGELMAEGDLQAVGEEEISGILNGGYDTIIADPMFKMLLKPSKHVHFVDFPIPAVSSKLHWEECVPFIGNKIEKLASMV